MLLSNLHRRNGIRFLVSKLHVVTLASSISGLATLPLATRGKSLHPVGERGLTIPLMPTLFDRIFVALRDILTAIFSSLTRKLCVFVLDGHRVMRFDANGGGFIDQFSTFDPGIQRAFGMGFGADGHLLVPMTKSGTALPFPIGIQRFHQSSGGLIDTF